MSGPFFVPRRSFLAGLGLATGGLVMGTNAFGQPKASGSAAKPGAPTPGAKGDLRADLFVQIAPDGAVRIVCQRSEMGQGIRSTIPALIADELGADMARVTIVQADGDKAYGDQNTDGSHSIRGNYEALRRVGATIRTMLVAAAAKKWNVPAASCTAMDHVVTHTPTKRTMGFGALALDAAKLPIPKREEVTLRPHAEQRVLRKTLPIVDAPDIVTGRAIFGADVRLPGMLTAVIARPPVLGGVATHHDDTRALAVSGVRKIVELPAPTRPFAFQPLGGIAVVADTTWAAMKGRAALDITWNDGENAAYESDGYRAAMLSSFGGSAYKTARKTGDAEAALASATKRVEAQYLAPHLAHAPMEPLVAVARFENGACEVWTSTQNPQAARTQVAKSLGIDEANVKVHVTLLGGGFGRKSKPDYVAEAALLSRAMSAPVRVQWTREDDIRHDYYHTTSAQQFVAGLDGDSKVVAWSHQVAFPPIGSIFTGTSFSGEGDLQQGVLDLPLAIPNVLTRNYEARAMTRIGWLRSVSNIFHAFAAQSFIDELSYARAKDPRDNLLEILGPPRKVTLDELGIPKLPNYGQSLDEHPVNTARHHRVLRRATELARWDDRKKDGRTLGLAVHRSFLTYVAAVVSVVKDPKGLVRVDEVWIVADAGTVVNRERVTSQLEGAVIFGLGLALYGEITMRKGATVQSNFRDYKLMRMNQAPRAIHAEFVDSDGPPGGVGEPAVPPVAPALANAIYALTGTRVRTLPIARSLSVA